MNQAHDTDTNSTSSSVLFALLLLYYTPNIMSNQTDEEAEFVSVSCARVISCSVSAGRNMSSRIQDTTYFCSRFKGQILPSISVILIRKGTSIEPPWLRFWSLDVRGPWASPHNGFPIKELFTSRYHIAVMYGAFEGAVAASVRLRL